MSARRRASTQAAGRRDRDHAQGPRRRAGDARRVRRLRVPVLRAAPTRSSRRCRSASASRLRFVFRNFPLEQRAPARPARPPRRRRRPARRGSSGRCTTCSSRTRTRWTTDDLLRYAEDLGLDVDRFASELDRAGARGPRPRGLPERRAQRRQRHADVLHQRRTVRRLLGRVRTARRATSGGQGIAFRLRAQGRGTGRAMNGGASRRGPG